MEASSELLVTRTLRGLRREKCVLWQSPMGICGSNSRRLRLTAQGPRGDLSTEIGQRRCMVPDFSRRYTHSITQTNLFKPTGPLLSAPPQASPVHGRHHCDLPSSCRSGYMAWFYLLLATPSGTIELPVPVPSRHRFLCTPTLAFHFLCPLQSAPGPQSGSPLLWPVPNTRGLLFENHLIQKSVQYTIN